VRLISVNRSCRPQFVTQSNLELSGIPFSEGQSLCKLYNNVLVLGKLYSISLGDFSGDCDF
jgi:hypothetical protein